MADSTEKRFIVLMPGSNRQIYKADSMVIREGLILLFRGDEMVAAISPQNVVGVFEPNGGI